MASQSSAEHLWRKVRVLSIAIDIKSDDYQLFLKRSDVYFQLRLFRLSALDASTAISLDDVRPDAVYKKSQALVALERYTEAESVWRNFQTVCPDSPRSEDQLRHLRYLAVKNIGFEERHCKLVSQNTRSVSEAIERALSFEIDDEPSSPTTASKSLPVAPSEPNNNRSALHLNSIKGGAIFARSNSPTESDETTPSNTLNYDLPLNLSKKSAEQVPFVHVPDFSFEKRVPSPTLSLQSIGFDTEECVETFAFATRSSSDRELLETPTKQTIRRLEKISPRKPNTVRKATPTPTSKSDTVIDTNSNLPGFQPKDIIEELINCPSFHRKLAETINKVYTLETTADVNDAVTKSNNTPVIPKTVETTDQAGMQMVATSEPSDLSFEELDAILESYEVNMPEEAIKNIMTGIENDPVYEEFLTLCQKKFTPNVDDSEMASSPLSGFDNNVDSEQLLESPQRPANECAGAKNQQPIVERVDQISSRSIRPAATASGIDRTFTMIRSSATHVKSKRSRVGHTEKRRKHIKKVDKRQFDHVKPYPDFVKNLMDFVDV